MKKSKSPVKVKKAQAAKPKRKRAHKTATATAEVKKLLGHKNEGRFSFSIKMGDDVFNTKADTIGEAMAAFRPEKITTKIVLTIENKDGRRLERYIFPQQMRRLIGNTTAMQYFVKNLDLMFNS